MGVTTRLHLKMEMKILQTIIVGILSFKTVVAGPQYGGGQQSQVSVPAPAPVVTQSCWMEQETIWDTQYVDQVTMECNEIVKQVPQRVSKSVPKQVCDDGGSYTQSQTGGGGGYGGGSSQGGFTSPRDQGNG